PVQPAMVPGGSQLSGLLPATRVLVSVTVPPWLAMPPPAAAGLASPRLPVMARSPWLTTPPPGPAVELPDTELPVMVAVESGALPTPPPNPEAKLPLTVLPFMVSTPLPG